MAQVQLGVPGLVNVGPRARLDLREIENIIIQQSSKAREDICSWQWSIKDVSQSVFIFMPCLSRNTITVHAKMIHYVCLDKISHLGWDDAREVLGRLHQQVHVHPGAVGAPQLRVGEQQLLGASLEGGEHRVLVLRRFLRCDWSVKRVLAPDWSDSLTWSSSM